MTKPASKPFTFNILNVMLFVTKALAFPKKGRKCAIDRKFAESVFINAPPPVGDGTDPCASV
jgi:hypothetical protein